MSQVCTDHVQQGWRRRLQTHQRRGSHTHLLIRVSDEFIIVELARTFVHIGGNRHVCRLLQLLLAQVLLDDLVYSLDTDWIKMIGYLFAQCQSGK
jgi:hypothetical protein